jgi:hypothetical protein
VVWGCWGVVPACGRFGQGLAGGMGPKSTAAGRATGGTPRQEWGTDHLPPLAVNTTATVGLRMLIRPPRPGRGHGTGGRLAQLGEGFIADWPMARLIGHGPSTSFTTCNACPATSRGRGSIAAQGRLDGHRERELQFTREAGSCVSRSPIRRSPVAARVSAFSASAARAPGTRAGFALAVVPGPATSYGCGPALAEGDADRRCRQVPHSARPAPPPIDPYARRHV